MKKLLFLLLLSGCAKKVINKPPAYVISTIPQNCNLLRVTYVKDVRVMECYSKVDQKWFPLMEVK